MSDDAASRIEQEFAEWDEQYEPDDGDDSDGCNTCGGEGWIVTCIDDLCRGAGSCIHGDGEEACPDCDAWMRC